MSAFPYFGPTGPENVWSNGGDTTMFPMGGYEYSNVFGSFGYPQFGWEYSSGNDYYGNHNQGRKDARGYEDYYRPDNAVPTDGYGAVNGELDRDGTVASMEQGLKGMSIAGDKKMENMVPVDVTHVGGAEIQTVPQVVGNGGPPQVPKSWAAIASQPARPQPQLKPRSIPRAPVNPNKHNMDIGTWDNKNNMGNKQPSQQNRGWTPRRSVNNYSTSGNSNNSGNASNGGVASGSASNQAAPPVLDKLRIANQYNPKDFNTNPKGARFFIIKSYSEDDIHRSIKYSIWCSTEHGNKRLDQAYREREGKGPVYLLFSVNGSGHFCGMAQMMSPVDYHKSSGVWAQDKWKGQFQVKWIYAKDVPNSQLRHIRLENNENKPVTNSRDTQEVPPEKGKQVLKILHNYRHTTSIFDDFSHYEKRQEEENGVPTKRR